MSESLGAMDVEVLANAVLRSGRKGGYCFFTLLVPVDGETDVFANPTVVSEAGLSDTNLVPGTPAFILFERGEKGLRATEILAFHKDVMKANRGKPKTGNVRKTGKPKAVKRSRAGNKPFGKVDGKPSTKPQVEKAA